MKKIISQIRDSYRLVRWLATLCSLILVVGCGGASSDTLFGAEQQGTGATGGFVGGNTGGAGAQILSTGGSAANSSVCQTTCDPGPAGPAGPAGANGAKGDKGDRGDPGQDGAVGAAGPQGSVGPQGPPGSSSGSQGPIGPQGPVGLQGPQGPQGPVGPAGAKGDVGSVGPAGPRGDVGPAGPATSMTRTSVYQVTAAATTNGIDYVFSTTANCKDANDIPLSGSCYVGAADIYDVTYDAVANLNANTNLVGGWQCGFRAKGGAAGTLGTNQSLTASVTCLVVP